MNAVKSIKELQVKLADKEMLLSDGILETMRLLRTKLPESINIWLNRELMGLNPDDIRSFKHLGSDYYKIRLIKDGVWCHEPVEGVFVTNRNSSEGIFLSLGVQTLEAELRRYLDLENLASVEKNFPPELRHSFAMLQVTDSPGYYFRCYIRDLVRVYSKLRSFLICMLGTISDSFSGASLLYL